MTIRPIRLIGDPVLRQPSLEVVDFDLELRTLVTDLTDTMLDANGGGIAAPQIGIGLRVFTWRLEDEIGHVVNPVVRTVDDEEQYGPEGCLSIPGLKFDCRRYREVVVSGFTMHGEPLELGGDGRLAMIIQHETDHLDGILFVDRLDADVRDVDAVLARARELLDFSQPIGVMLVALLHMLGDEDDPRGLADRYMAAVPPGSYLVLSHLASDVQAKTMAQMRRRINELMPQHVHMRTKDQVSAYFGGMPLVEPGVVLTHQWRPGTEAAGAGGVLWAGVARKS